MRATIAAVLLALALPLAADDLQLCATSQRTIDRAEELDAWAQARMQQLRGKGPVAPQSTVQGNILLLAADPFNSPFSHPIDLQGKTLVFTPKDAATYTGRAIPIEYDEAIGNHFDTGTAGMQTVHLPFSFPFFGRNVSDITITGWNAILIDAPPALQTNDLEQWGELELASQRQAAIAPLLTTIRGQSTSSNVYLNSGHDSVTVSWTRATGLTRFSVQAKILRDGTIRLSYKSVEQVPAAAVIITSGNESWRNASAPIADVDLPGSSTALAMLDITHITLSRVSDLDLLRAKITLAGEVNPKALSANQEAIYSIRFGDNAAPRFYLYVDPDGTVTYQIPGWGTIESSPAARIEGNTVTLDLLQDQLPVPPDNARITVATFLTGGNAVDSYTFTASLGGWTHRAGVTMSGLDGSEIHQPIAEAFTAPVFSPSTAWKQLKQAYGFDDKSFDSVAFYQNYWTDLVFYAGAYSTVGNHGATGTSKSASIGPNRPLAPALLHMNKLGYGWNATNDRASHVVMHELGHHWLFFIRYKDGTSDAVNLNPDGGHPAQWVHTPAAFHVYADTDTSVMGGGWFSDNGNGTFKTAKDFTNYGYSWLDLYLMGLASPNEVQPLFWIDKSSPALGSAYYPPVNSSFSGERHDVTIDQVIQTMGTRTPAYPNTPNAFKVLFVLMTDPSRPVGDADLEAINSYRTLLEQNFPVATGHRATVSTSFTIAPPPHRRAAGR
jgi:hypothetical protein